MENNKNGIFKIGIMGAGGIANHFCEAVKLIDRCEVTAVASKSLERSGKLARKQGIAAAYDDYEELLRKQELDCVYIAVTQDAHFDLSMLCLDYRVPVLCEKAMYLNSSQAEAAFARAKDEHIFMMEAMWSRFLPHIKKAKEWIADGLIGNVTIAEAAIGFPAPRDFGNRYFSPALGGGAAYDLLVYPYEILTFLLDGGIVKTDAYAVWGESGVDYSDHVVLHYGDKIVSMDASIAGHMDEKIVICGEKGKIVMPRAHCGNEAYLYTEGVEEPVYYKDEVTKHGFVYEIEEAIRCIENGEVESPVIPHQDTMSCAAVFDLILATKPEK